MAPFSACIKQIGVCERAVMHAAPILFISGAYTDACGFMQCAVTMDLSVLLTLFGRDVYTYVFFRSLMRVIL